MVRKILKNAALILCAVMLYIVYAEDVSANNEENSEIIIQSSVNNEENYTIEYKYKGENLKTVILTAGNLPEKFTPEIKGKRLSGWSDEAGNPVNPEEIPAACDAVYEAECYPLFGTDEPYLFANDIKLILPQDALTFADFSKAIHALIPEDSSMPKGYFYMSDDNISGESIKSFLSAFFSQKELQLIPMTSSVSRAEFAHIMNILTKRNDEKIVTDDTALQTVDLKEDTPYREDVLEASIAHCRSENGMSWDEVQLDMDRREYEPYSEMVYREPTEHGTVFTSYGKNWETYMYYLPYGYDESKQYNVLLYLAGGDGDPNWILGSGPSYAEYNKVFDRKINTLDFLDSLIQYGYCDPMIVCTTYTTMGTIRVERYIELLQYTIDNFSTYAQSSAIEDIVAARKHFAITGPSNASQSICVTIQNLPDMFAYYGMFSGMYELNDTIEAFSKLDDIEYLVMGAGEYDNNRSTTEKAYARMSVMDNVKDSDFVLASNLGHCRAAFDAGLLALLYRFNPNTRNIR